MKSLAVTAAAAAHVLDRRDEDAEVGEEQVGHVTGGGLGEEEGRPRGQGAKEAQVRVGLGSSRQKQK